MLLASFPKFSHSSTPNRKSILSFASTRFFNTLDPNSFPEVPTSTYYDDLATAAGRDGDFGKLRYLLNKRARDGCFNTSNTFKFITNTDASLSVLDDLVKSLSRLDRGFARKSACDALISRLCKLDRLEESLRVVDVMARGDYGLNPTSFHPILNRVTRKKRMEDAWRVVELMRAVGVSPDLTAFNYLLTAYCFKGDLTAACRVMERMEEEGLGADSRTYDALVLGACRVGKVEGAMVVLRRMEEDGVPVLYCTHAHVINALLGLGYYLQAVKFVIVCGGRDKGLDTESFGVLASKLIKLERFQEAKLVLVEMEIRGLLMGATLRDYYDSNVKNVE